MQSTHFVIIMDLSQDDSIGSMILIVTIMETV
jgi:hypothetical protein